jgi:hypothetical protein
MISGERVSNTLVTYPRDGDSSSKGEVIPDGPSAIFWRVSLAKVVSKSLCWVKSQDTLGAA